LKVVALVGEKPAVANIAMSKHAQQKPAVANIAMSKHAQLLTLGKIGWCLKSQ
jgi:hypothetical protein